MHNLVYEKLWNEKDSQFLLLSGFCSHYNSVQNKSTYGDFNHTSEFADHTCKGILFEIWRLLAGIFSNPYFVILVLSLRSSNLAQNLFVIKRDLNLNTIEQNWIIIFQCPRTDKIRCIDFNCETYHESQKLVALCPYFGKFQRGTKPTEWLGPGVSRL